MDSSELESRLKSLRLRQASAGFGKPETLAEVWRNANHPQGLIERFKNMPWKLKSAGGIGIAASLLAVYMVLSSSSDGSVAFAQVISKLNEAKTLSFDSEIKSVTDGKVLHRSRNYYMVPSKHRSESRDTKDGGGFVVLNSKEGKVLMVDSKRKTARISSFKGATGRDMAAETIEGIRSLQAKESRPVGEKQINGRQAKGFEFDRGHETTTVWTSVETGNLIQIQIVHKNVPAGLRSTLWTNIKLDEQLDPSLFSVEAPPGFAVVPFMEIDANASPANYVAESLRFYAKHNNDQFPEDLQKGLTALLEKLAPKQADDAPTEEVTQLSFYGAASLAAIRSGKRGELWQYFPDVTFGEKDKIVFWLHEKRKKAYSAVFGDLRVELVAREQLPLTPSN